MKRVLSLVLAILLVITMLPMQASAAKGSKLIALTFDDGPDTKDTPRLLDGLKEKGVKVTFFMQGQFAQSATGLVARAYAEGHEIGSHSWDHPNLAELSWAEVERQFERSYAVFDKICGTGSEYLIRPPYGITNDTIRANIDAPLIHWSVDTRDWESLNAYSVRDAILNESYDGAIVLLHDIHSTSVDGVLMAIDTLKARGFEFVTVSELFRRRGVEMKDGERYYECKPNGTDLGPIATPKITYTTDKVTMEITITADTDAPIYYTTDGSTPNNNSKVYTGPFTVDYPCDIKAVAAYNMNGSRSDTAILAFGQTPCAAPEIIMDGLTMTLKSDAEDVDIYYTIDGSTATSKSTLYTGPVEVPGGHYIHAVAGGGFYKMSKETVLFCSHRGVLMADVKPTDWYYKPIDRLVSEGLMSGVGNHCFEPHTKLTRGMLVALLYKCSGEDLGDGWTRTNKFSDVNQSKYYAKAVEWAWRSGVVSGYTDGTFRPNGNITRQELCVVIDSYLEYRGCALPRGESCKGVFADYGKIARWAKDSVEALVSAGMLSGDGTNVNPTGSATRAEVSAILNRVLDYEASMQPEVPDEEPEPDPTEPTDPSEPEPTEPEEPTEPSEPEETTEPSEPEETTEPTEPEETTEPSEPEETTEPSEPEETTEPTEPEETTEPSEPEETTEPSETTEAAE